MEWWKLGLEYLKAVLGWPVITLAIAVVLKKQISGLLRRDLEAEAAGVRVRVGRAEEAAEAALEEATHLASPDSDAEVIGDEDANPRIETKSLHVSNSYETAKLSGHIAALEAQLNKEEARRIALERVLSEGARLGWEWAQAGEGEPPMLTVQWGLDGVPHVSTERNSRTSKDRGGAYIASHEYERRILSILTSRYPGLIYEQRLDSGYDAAIITGHRSIGLVIKYFKPKSDAPRALIKSALSSARRAPFSKVLIISNVELPRKLAEGLYVINKEKSICVITWDPGMGEKYLTMQIDQLVREAQDERVDNS
ncbi:hypothetical protein [Microbispora sp. KK1-11]|uniref:hypothetical protein n=1 Tax=Microbispora sp. KK1-11 TaxID=2053005 RepID=UPI001158E18B|nr:hypothetical protein [Microbispora sp. KK1-11]TQS20990.1 hypothetical protein FLW16_40100 [Microbispora sp. KK1-11]